MRLAAALTAMTLALPAAAQELQVPSGTYTLDPTHTSVVWKVSHFGLSNYTGRFETISGLLELDAESPAESVVTVTVDPASISTGFPFPEQEDFDGKLAGPEWFASGEHPEITFTTTGIEVTGDNTGTMTGDLTMMGTTLPVTFEVTMNAAMEAHPMISDRAALGFSAVGTVDRTEFGLENLSPAIGQEVEILIEAEFLQAVS
ncbi:YceI family protein [Aestuariibius sp. 2305UL40-4]|uniref:YceI family protein n=1 Tax=Aestuariibius violaceus TaxID=3234132 RepID=UPI0034897FD6